MKRSLLLSLLFAFATILGREFCCAYTYYGEAHGWLKLHRVPENWRDARLRCHQEGGTLASPLNHELALAMRAMVAQSNVTYAVLTGINALFSRGQFHSIEGIPLSKMPHTWVDGESDNFNVRKSCMMMLQSGEIADVDCTVPMPYLCFKRFTLQDLNNCGTFDNEYMLDPRTGNCYKMHLAPRNWSRAYMACEAEGGHLAIINSDTEAEVIKDLFATKYPSNLFNSALYCWQDLAIIGFHNWNERGEFLTIDGQTLKQAGYSKYYPGEPNNNGPGESCGTVFRNGLLNDAPCSCSYPSICEKNPESLVCNYNYYEE